MPGRRSRRRSRGHRARTCGGSPLARAGRDSPLVEDEMAARRQRHLPPGARDAGQAEVRVKAERDRHRRGARRPDRRRDAQPVDRAVTPRCRACGETGRRPAARGGRRSRAWRGSAVSSRDVVRQCGDACSRPWIGSPCSSQCTSGGPERQADVAPVEHVVVPRQAVGPWVQERHAHDGSGAGVGEQARLTVEQLVAAMPERHAGHAERRRELRLQRAGRQRHGVDALQLTRVHAVRSPLDAVRYGAWVSKRSHGHGLALP